MPRATLLTRTSDGPYNSRVRENRVMLNCGTAALLSAVALLTSALAAGCDALPWFSPRWTSPPPVKQEVPKPIDELLPKKIIIHGWTGTRDFAEHGGIAGLDVRVQAKDGFGDHTKAFGNFRFELYHYTGGADNKGDRIAVWNQDVLEVTDAVGLGPDEGVPALGVRVVPDHDAPVGRDGLGTAPRRIRDHAQDAQWLHAAPHLPAKRLEPARTGQ